MSIFTNQYSVMEEVLQVEQDFVSYWSNLDRYICSVKSVLRIANRICRDRQEGCFSFFVLKHKQKPQFAWLMYQELSQASLSNQYNNIRKRVYILCNLKWKSFLYYQVFFILKKEIIYELIKIHLCWIPLLCRPYKNQKEKDIISACTFSIQNQSQISLHARTLLICTLLCSHEKSRN